MSDRKIIESEIEAVFDFGSPVQVKGHSSMLGAVPKDLEAQISEAEWQCSLVGEETRSLGGRVALGKKELCLEVMKRHGRKSREAWQAVQRLYESYKCIVFPFIKSKLAHPIEINKEGYEELIQRTITADLIESLPCSIGEWIADLKKEALHEIKAGTYLSSIDPPYAYLLAPTGHPVPRLMKNEGIDRDVFMAILDHFAHCFLSPIGVIVSRYVMHANSLNLRFEFGVVRYVTAGSRDLPSDSFLGSRSVRVPLGGTTARATDVQVDERSVEYYRNILLRTEPERGMVTARFDRSSVPGTVGIGEFKGAWWIWSLDYELADGPFDSPEDAEAQFWPTGITSALTEVVTYEESIEAALAKLNLYFDESQSDEGVEFTLTLGGVDGDANAKRQLSEVAVVDQSTEDGRQLVIKRAS